MNLLQDIARAYQALMQFECKTAIELFTALPPQHYNTGWVLCQVGRAHFELSNYQKVGPLTRYSYYILNIQQCSILILFETMGIFTYHDYIGSIIIIYHNYIGIGYVIQINFLIRNRI